MICQPTDLLYIVTTTISNVKMALACIPKACSLSLCIYIYIYIFPHLFAYLELHPWHMEVPRLGVQSELQLPAYTRATATLDPNCVCNLHQSSQQHWILNPLSEARE